MKYQILYASEPEELVEKVQTFLDAGWFFQGPLVITYGTDAVTGRPRVLFAREMTRMKIKKEDV